MTNEHRNQAEPQAETPEAGREGAGAAPPGAEAGAPAEEPRQEAGSGPAVPDESTAELEALQRELESLNDRHLRLAAEFDNYRKRIERERAELWTRAQADLAKRLLEVLDDLQRVSGHDAAASSVEGLLEGVELVEKKYRHALESAGLEPIEVQGQFFNPATMEALMTVPAEHPEEDEVVVDVFQKGYRFRGQLIRPARVRVKKYEE